MLKLADVVTYYGPIQILKSLDLEVRAGEIVCLLGGNASGKSTTMKTILGIVRPRQGTVEFEGQRIDGLPTEAIVNRGISLVPEARRIFGRMTVWENLTMGAYTRRREPPAELEQDLDRVYGLFPRLRERAGQKGGTLSGGEQQMLAMARALMARPRLLLMDEPSMGLAPALVDQVFDIIQTINRQGTTILVVEQNATVALGIAHRGYVLQNGRIVVTDTAQALLRADDIRRAYLGEAGDGGEPGRPRRHERSGHHPPLRGPEGRDLVSDILHILPQQIVFGLALGSVYGLIALGYTMVYGILFMINFAHGEVFMLGAYLGWCGAGPAPQGEDRRAASGLGRPADARHRHGGLGAGRHRPRALRLSAALHARGDAARPADQRGRCVDLPAERPHAHAGCPHEGLHDRAPVSADVDLRSAEA